MFTGIIEAVGSVKALSSHGGDVRITLNTASLDMADVKLGDSIACNGICLTVVDFGTQHFVADVSGETLRHTVLRAWKIGTRINLEKALLPTTRLGGHLVSGHVDGVGEIITAKQDARSLYFEIKAPEEIGRYLAKKGSVTVDGISLTINELQGSLLSLNLVPHTAEKTNVLDWKVGGCVNLEVDVLARYLERLLLNNNPTAESKPSGINMAFLADNGFLK